MAEREGQTGDFVRAVYAAYQALAVVRCHRLAPPGIKGMQEELLGVAGVSYDEMMAVVCCGWPNTPVDAGGQDGVPAGR